LKASVDFQNTRRIDVRANLRQHDRPVEALTGNYMLPNTPDRFAT
jgi:hypothetical protein